MEATSGNVPSRCLPLEGGINFRDLGGYSSRYGGRVAWRSLLRCGHLTHLTESDLKHLRDLQIAAVHDFRRPEERQRMPSLSFGATHHEQYDIHVGSLSNFWELLKSGQLNAELSHQLVVDSYSQCHQQVATPYRVFFEQLLRQQQGVTVFHCAAGKDRTGMAAALILGALGVAEDDIVEDYLLTDTYFDHRPLLALIKQHLRNEGIEEWEPAWVMPYCCVHEENIRGFLTSLKQHYGGIEGYLTGPLALSDADLQQLRDRYLQP